MITVRHVGDGDADAVLSFLRGLSMETLYRRFFSIPRVDDRLLAMVVHPSECCSEAFVALAPNGDIVGLASYDRHPDDAAAADVSVVIADAWQHHGVATVLLRKLSGSARRRGVERFTATMLADNRAVVSLVRRSNPSAQLRFDGTELTMEASLPAA